jgi:Protein of unknown function (DUF2510)
MSRDDLELVGFSFLFVGVWVVVVGLLLAGVVLALVVATRQRRSGRQRWFADPSRQHGLRYWDGQRWTGHVVDRGIQAVDLL